MNIQFNKAMLNLADEPIKDEKGNDLTCGRVLANSLVNQSEGDSIKYLDWARKLYKGEPLNLDRSDRKNLEEFVQRAKDITVLAKGQLLEILDNGGKEE